MGKSQPIAPTMEHEVEVVLPDMMVIAPWQRAGDVGAHSRIPPRMGIVRFRG